MTSYKTILLASHGTKGAVAAEDYVSQIAQKGAAVDHLEVVPDFWKGMMGDDWLNNAATQMEYGQYVETQLEGEIQEHINELHEKLTALGLGYAPIVNLGKPHECLIDQASKKDYDLILIGSPRPKGESGYRSRMKLEPLIKALTSPLMIVPFPL